MGGYGSGPTENYSRIDIEDCLYFDLTMLKGRVDKINPDQHHMSFISFNSGQNIFLEFNYPESGGPTIELTAGEVINTLELVSITQPLGGVRWWLKCPVTGKQCRKVFLPPGGGIFASRQAHRLKYRSQRLTKEWRLRQQCEKIHQSLGGTGAYDEVFPRKPRNMHSSKYSKLYLKSLRLRGISLDLSKQKLKRSLSR